jgi:hypothetical protein
MTTRGASKTIGRRSATMLCLVGVVLLDAPCSRAETSAGDAAETASSQATSGGPESTEDAEPRATHRQRARGVILTVVGLSASGGGAAMAAIGFDDQREVGHGEVLRPLAIVFLGVGLALAGIGLADLIASYVTVERPGVETAWLRLRPPTELSMAPPRLLARR